MSGTNHVAGGIVFTGIFCSFWDVNIFSDWRLLMVTGLFALLPDIDHTRSILGKAVYPVAKWMDRRFGHRTITHSLIVFLGLTFLISFLETVYAGAYHLTLIFFFAYLSHLIFDMMTRQGVPLFYPFKRNACVIPGNPELRLKSGDLKVETSILVVFIIIGITCKPLFANGFWTSYNRSFGTLKHLYSEFKNSDDLLSVQYSYKSAGRATTGTGLLVDAQEGKAVLFQEDRFVLLNDAMQKIINVLPDHTNKPYKIVELFFIDISPDSLRKLISNKPLLTFKLQSLGKMSYVKDKKLTIGQEADLEYVYNPRINFIDDSLKTDVQHQIRLHNYDLETLDRERKKQEQERETLNDSIRVLTRQYDKADMYTQEVITRKLQTLKQQREVFVVKVGEEGRHKLEIEHLESQINTVRKTTCSGYISYLLL